MYVHTSFVCICRLRCPETILQLSGKGYICQLSKVVGLSNRGFSYVIGNVVGSVQAGNSAELPLLAIKVKRLSDHGATRG